MNPLKAAYRAITPARLREHLADRRFHFERWLNNPRAQWETLAQVWLALRRPVRPVRTPYGTVFVDLRDLAVGRMIYTNRTYEEAETRFLLGVLKPGMVHLDVGANVGFLAAVAASRVGPTGRVIALEPDPYNFRLLSRAVRENRWPQVTALNTAAGAAPGTARLFKSDWNLGDHRLYADDEAATRATVTVPVGRVDDILVRERLPAPDFVKIDVQGYEWFVANGMERTLAGDRLRAVLTEFWPHGMRNAGGDPQGYLDTFRRHGFGCFRPTPAGGLEPVEWGAVWGLIPPFDPDEPDACWTNLVFARPQLFAGGR
jgi:FkbM family methyltransferase